MAKRQRKECQEAEPESLAGPEPPILGLTEDQTPAWFRHSGYPDMPEIRCGNENWWPFFSRISNADGEILPTDLHRAIQFWENYGDFLAATPDRAVLSVKHACLPAAARIISKECERRGWDSSSIMLVTDFRNGLFSRHPETIPHSSPWPPHDFVTQNPSLPDYRQSQILEAERLLTRLKAQPAEDHVPANGTASKLAQPGSAKMSPRELATKYGINAEALRKRLDHWRYDHDAGYVEVSNAARNEPRYLYDESAVMPIIDALRAKAAGRKRAANVQQKKT